MKVLIIQQKMIGDVLTSTILFEQLKDRFPISELHFLINENTKAVLENNPFIDRLKIVPNEARKNKRAFYTFILSLRSEHYDVIIDAYGKVSSLLVCMALKASKKIGYSKSYTKFIYTHSIKRIKIPEHNNSLAIENRLRLLTPFEIEYHEIKPHIYLLNSEKNEASSYLKTNGVDLDKQMYMISVLGSDPKKSYPKKYMAKLLDMICEVRECQLLFNYTPKQIEEIKAIYQLCNEKTKNAIKLDIYGSNLRSFIAITSFCDALIGNEGGAINMAKALGVPTFAIFSPHLKKHNWFGKVEEDKHVAISLSDFMQMEQKEMKSAKKNPEPFYLKMTPEFLQSPLEDFISQLND